MKKNTELVRDIIDFIEENGVVINRETWYFRNGCSFENVFDAIKHLYKDGVIVWGASNGGLMALRKLQKHGVGVKFFVDIDKNKQGNKLEGIPILSPELIKKDDFVVIGTIYVNEVVKSLIELGVNNYLDILSIIAIYELGIDGLKLINHLEKISTVHKSLSDEKSKKNYINIIAYVIDKDAKHIFDSISDYKQYFHPDVKPEVNDVIVDAGAYTGDTVDEIIKTIGNRCKIYCFEPDQQNFSILKNKYKGFTNIIPENYGLWNENTILQFSGQGNMGSHIAFDKNSDIEEKVDNYYINTVSLDSYFQDKEEKPNLIKMDIEGAEYDAILGAQNIIKQYKPKLQICIYHKSEHFFEIPLLIKNLVPEYRMYVGHHTSWWADTVLYCKI